MIPKSMTTKVAPFDIAGPLPGGSVFYGVRPMSNDHTTTQPAPNISTENQDKGDARRPGDTLNRPRDKRTDHTETQPVPNISTEN